MITNFIFVKRTRRKPQAGDIFAFQMQPLPDRYFFGRVVATDILIGGLRRSDFPNGGGMILIYIYKTTSDSKENIPLLKKDDLLVPPIGTNAKPWTLGYFEVVRSGVNAKEDLLPVHCFKDPLSDGFVDEYGNRLLEPSEPVGFDGVSGLGSIDNKVSDALGLPRIFSM